MAVLQKIRKRSGLLLLAIGFALLAFVVQDLFTKGFKSQSNDVGSINDKDILFEDFRVKVANAEKGGQNGPVSQMQAVNQVWENQVAIALLDTEFDKLGIRITDKHIIDNFKNDPNIGQNPMFQNQLGKFDLNKFKEYFKSNPAQAEYAKEREKEAELGSKYAIYSTMIKAGMYTTDADGKFKYEMESNKTAFDYVAVLYSTVKDSDIKLTDADYIDYMKKHEKRFKSDGTREIEYVLIEEKPSTKDEEEVKAKIDKFLTATDSVSFRNTTNMAEFLAANSDVPYDTVYKSKQDLPAEHADKIFATPTGEIYGPYLNGKFYSVSKVTGRKAGAKVKASHILISYEGADSRVVKKEKRTKEEAKAKAEKLLAEAQANPNNFFMLALTNSDDSSAQQGGDLGYFGPGQMVKPFNDFVFSNPVGKIGLVETEFGFHIINVTDKQDAIRLATLGQKIEPSQQTTDDAYAKATDFEMKAAEKDFAVVAKEAKLTVNPAIKAKPMDEAFGAVGNQRQIIKWAYTDDTKIGDVKRFDIVNVGHVIAKLTKINEKGLMTVEDAKPMLESILKNKKKAEKLMAKMKGGSLESIATANKTTVQQAVDLTLENPMLGAGGPEPKVVGTAFGLGANKTSAPIEGNMGVYVIRTKSVTKAPKLPKYTDYVTKLNANNASAAGRALQALKTDAKIEDNRLEFY